MDITVAARNSPLSQAQCQELLLELSLSGINVRFRPSFLATYGDLDRKTSLRTLGKSDFFTREVNEMVITGKCQIAVHSAKDLDLIPLGLALIALTKGIDPSDSLIFRQGETLETLSPGAIIATSSNRREEAVKQLRSDFIFIDLRGTIGERIAKLETGEADGVVVAEAALIRLQLTHLNRITLPGETTPLQGQLAIIAREGDNEMAALFSPLDSRK